MLTSGPADIWNPHADKWDRTLTSGPADLWDPHAYMSREKCVPQMNIEPKTWRQDSNRRHLTAKWRSNHQARQRSCQIGTLDLLNQYFLRWAWAVLCYFVNLLLYRVGYFESAHTVSGMGRFGWFILFYYYSFLFSFIIFDLNTNFNQINSEFFAKMSYVITIYYFFLKLGHM